MSGGIRRGGAGTIILVAICALYIPAIVSMFNTWDAVPGYSQGYLLGPVAMFVFYKQFSRHQKISINSPAWLIILVAFSSISWLFGYLSATQVIQTSSFVALLGLTYLSLFGVGRFRELLIPIVLLSLGLPVWSVFTEFLQSLTIYVTSFALQSTGRTVYIDGDFVFLPAGVFEIAAGCAGLHFFVVSLSIAVLYAYLYYRTVAAFLVLLLLAGVTAICANWIRVFTIILAGDLTDMQHFLVAVDHYYFGWAVFALSLAPFFLLGKRLQHCEIIGHESNCFLRFGLLAGSVPAKMDCIPLKVSKLKVIALVSALLIPPLMSVAANVRAFSGSPLPDILESSYGNWERESFSFVLEPTAWFPIFKGAQSTERAKYSDGTFKVDIFVSRYLRQRQDNELLAYGNRWHNDEWIILSDRVITVDAGRELSEVRVREIFSPDGRERRIVVFGYLVGDRIEINTTSVRMMTAALPFSKSPVAGAFVVSGICQNSCEEPAKSVESFLSIMLARMTSIQISD